MNLIKKIFNLLHNQSSGATSSQTNVERQSDGLSDEEFRAITDLTMGWSPANGIAPHSTSKLRHKSCESQQDSPHQVKYQP